MAYRGAARKKKDDDDGGSSNDKKNNNSYYGGPRRRRKGRSSSFPSVTSNKHQGTSITSSRSGPYDRSSEITASKKYYDKKQAAANAATRKNLEDNLYGLHQDLRRLAKDYHNNFISSSSVSSIPTTEEVGGSPSSAKIDGSIGSSIRNNKNNEDGEDLLQQQVRRSIAIRIEYHDENAKHKAMIRSMARQVRTTFKDIHDKTDIVVTMQHVYDTEDAFRNLCRALQKTIKLATELHKLNIKDRYINNNNTETDEIGNIKGGDDDDSGELIDLAEASLAALAKVRSDRALLVESTRTWTANNLAFEASAAASDDGGYSGSSRRTNSPWMSFVQSLLSPSPEDSNNVDRNNSISSRYRGSKQVMAHEDPILGVTQALFATVMDALAAQASSLQNYDDNNSSIRQQSQQKHLQKTSRRMIALLDAMPSSWIPDEEVVKRVLETLCQAGSLDSARLSLATYRRHPNNNNRLRFSLVLQAYLEACQNESVNDDDDDSSKVLLAVREVLDALHSEWDVNLPRHRVERIVHSSLVLNCLCVAERRGARVPNLHRDSVNVVKRSIGKEAYRILQDPKQWNNSKSGDIFPLVNCLAQVYAMGESPNFEKARHLLSYLMQHDRQGVGRFMVHPMVDTFNAVLLSLLLDYEGKPEQKKSIIDDEEDNKEAKAKTKGVGRDVEKSLDYATSLLDYMLSGREATFWPNDETFSYLFRLLVATKPKEIGQRAQHILSKMEIRRAVSSLSGDYEDDTCDSTINISLSIYHRVLRCWLEAAKDKESTEHNTTCAQSALQILDKLEAQSIPLLMNDRETQISSLPSLYDIQLRPTRRTYGLVHQICLSSIKHDDKAIDVAFAVYDKLSKRGMVNATKDLNMLKSCVDQLPDYGEDTTTKDEKKAAAEARLQSIKDNENVEMIVVPPVALASVS